MGRTNRSGHTDFFARLHGKFLSITPLYIQRDDHAIGLFHLLTLAVRLLALGDSSRGPPPAPNPQDIELNGLLLASAISFSTTDEASLSEFVNAGFVVFALTLKCGLQPGCLDSFFNGYALINQLGSMGMNTMIWTADMLQQAFLSTYPHVSRPVSPGALVLSLGLSNTPVLGDLYDLYTGRVPAGRGYDPITGQYLAGWERLANIAGAIPIFGVSDANIRHGLHSAESFVDQGDDMARFIGQTCSFDEETPVSTKDGLIAIGEIDVGDQVLAWDEATGATGYYTVTATMAHVDPVVVHLTINGETIATRPEHPFYERETTPSLPVGETAGRWTLAGELKAGDQIQQADGTTGIVQTVVFEATDQLMYNLTVADVHTYVVGGAYPFTFLFQPTTEATAL